VVDIFVLKEWATQFGGHDAAMFSYPRTVYIDVTIAVRSYISVTKYALRFV
jgi:hypothetical protein